MKILLVSVHFAPAWIEGGVTFSSWNLMRGLARAGAAVRVVTTNAYLAADEQVPERRDECGLSIRTVPIARALGAAAHRYGLAPGLARAVREECAGVDLCLLQGMWAAPVAIGASICRRRGIPYVLSARGTLERISLSEKSFKKAVYIRLFLDERIRRAAAIHFVSESERRNSRSEEGDPPGVVIPNGFDPVEPAPRRGDLLRRRLGLPGDRVLVGLSGRLHPRKGFDVLLPALAHCPGRIHLVSFGPDLEGNHASFVALARSVGVTDRFHCLGYLTGEALQSAYASIDLLALPSYGETFGNVVVDSLQQHTPVMVSDRVALADFVREHALGTVVEGLDPRRWGEALRDWASAPPPFDGLDAARTVQRHFGMASHGGVAYGVLDELLRSLRTRPRRT